MDIGFVGNTRGFWWESVACRLVAHMHAEDQASKWARRDRLILM